MPFQGQLCSPVRDDVVEKEDAAKGDLAGDHIALHVYAQLPRCILLIHLHVPAEGVHALALEHRNAQNHVQSIARAWLSLSREVQAQYFPLEAILLLWRHEMKVSDCQRPGSAAHIKFQGASQAAKQKAVSTRAPQLQSSEHDRVCCLYTAGRQSGWIVSSSSVRAPMLHLQHNMCRRVFLSPCEQGAPGSAHAAAVLAGLAGAVAATDDLHAAILHCGIHQWDPGRHL